VIARLLVVGLLLGHGLDHAAFVHWGPESLGS
jgi:hypothetical protein